MYIHTYLSFISCGSTKVLPDSPSRSPSMAPPGRHVEDPDPRLRHLTSDDLTEGAGERDPGVMSVVPKRT